MAEDPSTISCNCAIGLVQEQDDGLATMQKVDMIKCFTADVVAANTYLSLTDPEVH